jgi:hypothetical protein
VAAPGCDATLHGAGQGQGSLTVGQPKQTVHFLFIQTFSNGFKFKMITEGLLLLKKI